MGDAALSIKADQHCTSDECPYTMPHTAAWCGYVQTRRCDCGFCYPGSLDRRAAMRAMLEWIDNNYTSVYQALSQMADHCEMDGNEFEAELPRAADVFRESAVAWRKARDDFGRLYEALPPRELW